MNNNILSSSRFSSRLVAILIIVLIQLPAVTPALDFRSSILPSLFPIVSQPNTASGPLTVFSNATSFTVADRAGLPPIPPGVASLYPSPINVAGMVGTISDVNVTLSNVTSPRPRDLDLLLVSPTGANLVIMADAGSLCPIAGVTITLDDGAAGLLPDPINGCPPDPPITTGSYRPTNYVFGAEVDTFPAPAPVPPYNHSAPAGAATFASVFNASNPNGTWNLYVVDDSQGGGISTFAGGWSIDITTVGGLDPTTTVVSSNLNPALTTQNITFTSTTTNNTTATPIPAGSGTVNFTNNGVTIPGCGAVAIVAGGQAQCTAMLAEGTRTITANYSGTPTLGLSSGSVNPVQVVNSPTVVAGAQFCNNGGITVIDGGIASPVYPSTITVSNLFGTVSTVTAQLNSLNAPRTDNLDLLLVGPTTATFEMMSDTGENLTPVNINLTLSDAAASPLPQGSVLTSGTFRPADYAPAGNVESFPAPAPAAPYNAPAPSGASTFTTVYGTTNPNGNWRLFAADDGIGGGNTTIGSWCLNFTVTPFATTTTVASSQNPSIVGQSVTFTATVSSGAGTPTGTVQFLDGATPIGGPVALNGSGQATVITSALTAGNHTINANYSGATVGAGGGGFAAGSGSLAGGQNVSGTATWDGSASADWHTAANWTTNFVPAAATLNVDIPAAGVTNNPSITSADVTVANLTIGGTRTLTIGAARTLNATGVVSLGTGQVIGAGILSLGTAATITHGAGGQVNATLRKNFGGPGPTFEMPVGTTGEFSPLNVLVTAGSGQLTVRATDTFQPVLAPMSTRALQRYWTLSGSGIRSNITFNYLTADVPGPPNDENLWNIIRVTGSIAVRYSPSQSFVIMDPANNRFTINDLESYSDWTAGEPLAPTAANANVSGRVTGPEGRGVAGARVAMLNQEGNTLWAVTNPFGYYRFVGVPTGQAYLMSVSHKRFEFTPRTVTPNDDLTDIDFAAEPEARPTKSSGELKQPEARSP